MNNLTIKEDGICPITKEHCDDECCPAGAICNLSGGEIYDPLKHDLFDWDKYNEEEIKRFLATDKQPFPNHQVDKKKNVFGKIDPKDYTDDFKHENGNYQNVCTECKGKFIGHKRRTICRLCLEAGGIFDANADKEENTTTWNTEFDYMEKGEIIPVMSRKKFIELWQKRPDTGDSWISLKDKTPEKEKFVLLCNSHWVGVGRRLEQVDKNEPEYADEVGEYIDGITHWMPLPEKPIQSSKVIRRPDFGQPDPT